MISGDVPAMSLDQRARRLARDGLRFDFLTSFLRSCDLLLPAKNVSFTVYFLT